MIGSLKRQAEAKSFGSSIQPQELAVGQNFNSVDLRFQPQVTERTERRL